MNSTIHINPIPSMPMTAEQKEHELMRRELWIKVATAVAACDTCKTIESPARWADTTLKAFDEKFKVLSPIPSSSTAPTKTIAQSNLKED